MSHILYFLFKIKSYNKIASGLSVANRKASSAFCYTEDRFGRQAKIKVAFII